MNSPTDKQDSKNEQAPAGIDQEAWNATKSLREELQRYDDMLNPVDLRAWPMTETEAQISNVRNYLYAKIHSVLFPPKPMSREEKIELQVKMAQLIRENVLPTDLLYKDLLEVDRE